MLSTQASACSPNRGGLSDTRSSTHAGTAGVTSNAAASNAGSTRLSMPRQATSMRVASVSYPGSPGVSVSAVPTVVPSKRASASESGDGSGSRECGMSIM